MGQVMLGSRGARPGSYNASTVPNAPVRVCVANSAVRCKLSGVYWSYSDTPTTGRLTITGGGFNFDIDIRNSGPGYIPFVPPIHATDNTQVCITLYGGGVGVIGSVGVLSASSAVSRSELYHDKVRSYEPIAYWPQWENAGVDCNCIINPAQAGVYVGPPELGQPSLNGLSTCAFYDGANDYTNIATPALTAAFNGSEGSIVVWAQVADAGLWAGGVDYFVLNVGDGPLVQNMIWLYKQPVVNTFRVRYRAGGADSFVDHTTDTTDPFCIGLSWSALADEVRMYWNGVQTGTTQVGLGVWGGVVTRALIAAQNNVPTTPWRGASSDLMLFNRALAPTAFADLYVIP